MSDFELPVLPDRKQFDADPFGYSASAWMKWGMVRTLAGFTIDISEPPGKEDLKDPVLWLTQARAMSEAAVIAVSYTHLTLPTICSV